MNDNTNFELNGFDSAYKSNSAGPLNQNLETGSLNNTEPVSTGGDIPQPFSTQENAAGAQSFNNAYIQHTPVNAESAQPQTDISTPATEAVFTPNSNLGNAQNPPYVFSAHGAPINRTPPSPPQKPKEKKRFSWLTVVISVACSAIIAFTSAVFGASYYFNSNSGSGSEMASSSSHEVKNIYVDEEGFSVVEAVYEKCGQSIVGIRTTSSVMSFFGGQEVSGEGSGIIYSADGYILTNYHVISDSSGSSSYYGSGSGVASKIDVYLPNDPETAIPAKVVGYNISSDLAVLKIDKTGLPAIETGDSSDVKVGQFVVAIGNPGGLQFMSSVTYGVVSGVNRTLEVDAIGTMKLIQTDAAINPGNSGGALVNTEGKLIGINSSKLVDESYEGMGFAIPINEALEICDKIIENKDEASPYIGIEVSTRYTSKVLDYYNYPAGAVVANVDSGSPADKAGIQRGDIITEFNGVKITEYTVLNDTLRQCKVGQTVKAIIYRSGKYLTCEIAIGSSN